VNEVEPLPRPIREPRDKSWLLEFLHWCSDLLPSFPFLPSPPWGSPISGPI
jgi:hypothetical protein